MPRQPWVFKCPICDYDQVRAYRAKEGSAAHVVCGRCRTLVTFDPAPRMNAPIDLYNLYCDAVRPRMGSNVDPMFQRSSPAQSREVDIRPREAGGRVIIAAPLCTEHEFVYGEAIAGFRGEILAQTRICLKCGHAERDKV